MKTTFKKVFYELDDDFMNIDETSFSDIDFNLDKVKEDVFMNIKDNNSKKKFTKKFTVLLVAAIILVAGTVGVFATGDIESIFNNLFTSSSNMNALGLYDGGDVSITNTDNSLNVNLLGLTGDGEKLYAAIEVTKKDGSEVVDKAYTDANFDNSLLDSFDIDCKTKNGEKPVVEPLVSYKLRNDNKVLTYYLYFIVSEGDLKDGRMTYTNYNAQFYKIDYVFGSLDLPEGQCDASFDSSKSYFYSPEYEKTLREERGVTEEECMYLIRNGKREYCQASAKRFDIPFEISFDLNYDTDNFIEKKLSFEENPATVKEFAQKPKMSVTPFGVYLTAHCDLEDIDPTQEYGSQCFEDVEWTDTSKIVLDDGTVYYLYPYVGGEVDKNEKTNKYYEKYPLNYSTVIGPPWSREINVVDTREIKEVYINGELVFSK